MGHNAYLTDGVQPLAAHPGTSLTTPDAPPAPGFGRWRHERRADPAHRGRRARLGISLQPWKGQLWGSDSQLETYVHESLCTACNLCRASETCAELRERSDGSRSTSRE